MTKPPVTPEPAAPQEEPDPDPWCTSPDPAPDPQTEITSVVHMDYHPDRWGAS